VLETFAGSVQPRLHCSSFRRNEAFAVSSSIFAYCKPFSFAWMGGRLLILNEAQEIVDFGDGFMSKGEFGHHSGKFEHRVLGNMEADDTVFKLYDYNVVFDFNLLKNCNWLNKNKAKGKGRYESTAVHHLIRFSKKRTN
jgi:hypothetical protein